MNEKIRGKAINCLTKVEHDICCENCVHESYCGNKGQSEEEIYLESCYAYDHERFDNQAEVSKNE